MTSARNAFRAWTFLLAARWSSAFTRTRPGGGASGRVSPSRAASASFALGLMTNSFFDHNIFSLQAPSSPSGCRRYSPISATTFDKDIVETEHINGLTSPQSKTTSNDYSAQQITVLSGLEPVRKRPGMYIGSTGPDGLHHLVYEVLDNSVDEALAGHASLINVVLHDPEDGGDDSASSGGGNRCTITDNGRGIPTDLHPITKISALETVLTVLHAGGKFDNAQAGSGYKVSGGLHGVGISVVNALSEFVEVKVDRQNGNKKNPSMERKMMRFERGVRVGDLQDVDIGDDLNNGWEGVVFQTNEFKVMTPLGSDDDDDDDDDNDTLKGRAQAKLKVTTKPSTSSKKRDKALANEMDSTTLEYKISLVKSLSSVRKSGTTVTFLPDISVFKGANGKPGITFDETKLAMRMDEIAYLNAGLVLTLQDKRSSSIKRGIDKTNIVTIFHHAGGLSEYVDFLCRGKTPMFGEGSTALKSKGTPKADIGPPTVGLSLSSDRTTLLFHAEITPTSTSSNIPQAPIAIDAALRYTANSYNEQILSFVNNIRTRDGGTHVEGLKSCLTRALNQSAKRLGKLKEGDGNLSGDYIREGLTAIISVSVSEPEFEGQTKGRLGNPEVRPAVEAALGGELNKFFDFHPEILNILFENASRAAAAAAAAKAAREVVRKKTLLQSTILPGKLADCEFVTLWHSLIV
jgi:DNA gyrase subunit B